MRISRQEIITIREKMLNLLPQKIYDIESITRALIMQPTIIEAETDFRDLKRGVKKRIVDAGHGAFGERESDVYYYVCDVSVNVGDTIFLNSDGLPLCVIKVNLKKLVEELKVAHDNSFDIKL